RYDLGSRSGLSIVFFMSPVKHFLYHVLGISIFALITAAAFLFTYFIGREKEPKQEETEEKSVTRKAS
ncbi:MAG: hypothetical protein HQK54_10300, partial [Oligoflexales bacterium]|nr:hypothetical protein [Oligoflexales bacterium]